MAAPTGLSPKDVEQRALDQLPEAIRNPLEHLDTNVADFMRAHSVTTLRVTLAIVFIWFGALKVAGKSPVEDLVADTVYWVDAGPFVIFLGLWEIAIGLGLILGLALRLVLLLFFAQMLGTFLTVVIHPGVVFEDSNPLLLTVTGEFIVKNLVLIAAGIVIGSTVRRTAA